MTLQEIDSLKQLSDFLRIDLEKLVFFLEQPPRILDKKSEPPVERTNDGAIILGSGYQKFWVRKMLIPKKNKSFGNRVVYEILNGSLENLNKIIFFHLKTLYSPVDSVNGFITGRHIKRNAAMHLNKKVVLNVDIKDFFESITEIMVFDIFMKLGCNKLVAKSLARLTTLNGRLVQGFYTSPVIANLAANEMDKEFMRISGKIGCTYSRYADDICFSSDSAVPEISLIIETFRKYKFELNDQKTRFMYKGQKQYVTGLTVSDSQYPRVPRKMKKNIRLLLYYIKKFGVSSHLMHINKLANNNLSLNNNIQATLEGEGEILIKHFLRGHIDYINSIEPDLASKFYRELDIILEENK